MSSVEVVGSTLSQSSLLPRALSYSSWPRQTSSIASRIDSSTKLGVARVPFGLFSRNSSHREPHCVARNFLSSFLLSGRFGDSQGQEYRSGSSLFVVLLRVDDNMNVQHASALRVFMMYSMVTFHRQLVCNAQTWYLLPRHDLPSARTISSCTQFRVQPCSAILPRSKGNL